MISNLQCENIVSSLYKIRMELNILYDLYYKKDFFKDLDSSSTPPITGGGEGGVTVAVSTDTGGDVGTDPVLPSVSFQKRYNEEFRNARDRIKSILNTIISNTVDHV